MVMWTLLIALARADIAPPSFPTRGAVAEDLPPPGQASPPILLSLLVLGAAGGVAAGVWRLRAGRGRPS